MRASGTLADSDRKSRGGTPTPQWVVTADMGASYTVKMPVDVWVDLADHPRRRDSERHIRKPGWTLLMRTARGPVLEMLRWVVAGQVGDEVWKVDGHSRALLWANGSLTKPKSVFAKVFRCDSLEALHDLYATFDHPDAAETVFDRVSGAYHQHGLALRSERLRAGMIGDALSIAWRGAARTGEADGEEDEMDIYDAVGTFASELALLDSVNPQNDIFQTGVIAAALLSLALDPALIGYFDQVSKRHGSKLRAALLTKTPVRHETGALEKSEERFLELLDPVEALLHMIATLKGRRGAWGKAQQQELCAGALTGATAWKAGESHPHYWVRQALPPADLHDIVRQVRELKRVHRPSRHDADSR